MNTQQIKLNTTPEEALALLLNNSFEALFEEELIDTKWKPILKTNLSLINMHHNSKLNNIIELLSSDLNKYEKDIDINDHKETINILLERSICPIIEDLNMNLCEDLLELRLTIQDVIEDTMNSLYKVENKRFRNIRKLWQTQKEVFKSFRKLLKK